MRVLIAGATGYLGRYVVRACKERGWWVRALVRSPAKLERAGAFLEPPVHSYTDDVFVGEVTRPETLRRSAEGIDAVFSSVGITRQREGYTYRAVDYQGNVNLLEAARTGGVGRFVYTSVFDAARHGRLAIIRAHEDVVRALAVSGLPCTIMRPTGYFSDMSEVLAMARSGWVALIGRGENRINPIHGADLAELCADALAGGPPEIAAGGPETFTQNEIARLAFDVLGRRGRVIHIPPALAHGVVGAVRPFHRQLSDLLDFFVTAGQGDGVAPAAGTHRLRAYFEEVQRHYSARRVTPRP